MKFHLGFCLETLAPHLDWLSLFSFSVVSSIECFYVFRRILVLKECPSKPNHNCIPSTYFEYSYQTDTRSGCLESYLFKHLGFKSDFFVGHSET